MIGELGLKSCHYRSASPLVVLTHSGERLSLHKKGKKKNGLCQTGERQSTAELRATRKGKQLQHPVRTHKDTVSFVSFQCEMKHSDILYCFHTLQQNLNEIF